MKRFALVMGLFVAAVLLVAALAHAQAQMQAQRGPQRVPDAAPVRAMERPAPPAAHRMRLGDALDQTYRVTFNVVSPDGDDEGKPFSIMTARERFHIQVGMRGKDGAFNFQANGELSPDDKQGTVLVTFHTQMGIDNDRAEGGVSLDGSVIMKPGKPVTVADLGDKQLVIDVAVMK